MGGRWNLSWSISVAFISLGNSFPKELECWSPINYDLDSVRLRAEPCTCFVDTSDSEGDGHAPQKGFGSSDVILIALLFRCIDLQSLHQFSILPLRVENL